jgi:hypothetical protein
MNVAVLYPWELVMVVNCENSVALSGRLLADRSGPAG